MFSEVILTAMRVIEIKQWLTMVKLSKSIPEYSDLSVNECLQPTGTAFRRSFWICH
jgi:hypothetical protein